MRIPLRFAGFESSGQHYWEIDAGTYRKGKIRDMLTAHFSILEEWSPPLNKFHYFFILEPLPQKAGTLTADFVAHTYDSFISELPEAYSEYRWQKTPVSRFHHKQTTRALRRALSVATPSRGRVLEVGGGDGEWTPYFLEHATALDFVDISKEMIARAHERLSAHPHISYITADILSTPLREGAYSLVGSIRNLEYMSDKERVIEKYYRSLEKEGILCLITKNPESDFKGYFKNKPLHSGQISIHALRQMITEAGFTHMRIYPAIIGKKVAYGPLRIFWHMVHTALLYMPQILLPLYFMRLFSESFVITAKK